MGARVVPLLFAVVLLSMPMCGQAQAQTPTPLAFWQYSAGQVLVPIKPDAPKWRVMFGPSAVYMPEYEGSDNYELMPGALINIRYRERFYLSTGEGLGVDILRGENYRFGVSAAYSRGRDDDVDGIYGIGGIDFAPQLRLYAEYVLRPSILSHEFPVVLAVDGRRAFHSWQGYTANAGIYAPVLGSREDKYFVFLGGAASFADGETADTFFSITPQQAAVSGLSVYDADGCLANISIGVTAGWALNEHWLINGNVGAKRLLNDVSESPIVQDEWQFLWSLSVGYML